MVTCTPSSAKAFTPPLNTPPPQPSVLHPPVLFLTNKNRLAALGSLVPADPTGLTSRGLAANSLSRPLCGGFIIRRADAAKPPRPQLQIWRLWNKSPLVCVFQSWGERARRRSGPDCDWWLPISWLEGVWGGGGAVRCNTTHYLSSLSPPDRETLKSNIDPLLEILIPAEPDPVSCDLLNVPAQ